MLSGEELPAYSEKRLLKLLRREAPPRPVFAQGKDWDRSLRGLLLVGLDNRGGRLWKVIKEDEPEDEGVDPRRCSSTPTCGPSGSITTMRSRSGVGTCPDGDASESTARAIRGLLDRAR